MKKLQNQKFGRLLALEPTSERKSGCIVWKCQCDCGNICYISSHSLQTGNTKSCGCLNLEKKKQRIIKYNQENFNDLTNQHFGELIVLSPTNLRSGSNIVWKCQCSCGELCYVSNNHLKRGITKSCGHLKFQQRIGIDLTNRKIGKLTVLEPTSERKHGSVIWKCQCDCGNTCYVSSSSLVQQNTQSCGCLKSKGEMKIIQLLQNNQINFITQKTFNNCLFENNYHAYFDFYIDNRYLIEYDGTQHFKQTGWESLSELQARDEFKNQWCKENRYFSYKNSLYSI